METRHIGLARMLSKLGYCSRSQAAELIRAGRVAVNGRVRRNPEAPVREAADSITVDNAELAEARKIYLMMSKPRGLVTTAADEKDRETIYSLLAPGTPWLAPVGRLDKASEGLLLLTNDSEWAARITDPESHLEKTYHVQVRHEAQGTRHEAGFGALIDNLERGVRSEGELLCARSARVLRKGVKNVWLEIVLDEGRNRQIRRMLETLGFDVLRLVRVAIGRLQLGDLAKGDSRLVTAAEKALLDADRSRRQPVRR